MAGPRAIRLDLMHATGANISPIFSMFSDPPHRAREVIDRAAAAAPIFESTDGLGDVHRLWPMTDPSDVATLIEVLRDSTVTVADGHHRYATALDYMAEHPESEAVRYVLMGLIDVDDPGLVILPNHRLVRAEPPADLLERLADRFEVIDLTDDLPRVPTAPPPSSPASANAPAAPPPSASSRPPAAGSSPPAARSRRSATRCRPGSPRRRVASTPSCSPS